MNNKKTKPIDGRNADLTVSASVDELLARALKRGNDGLETGRYIVTFGARDADEGARLLKNLGIETVDARDFAGQVLRFDTVGGSEAVFLPELRAALVSPSGIERLGLGMGDAVPADSLVEAVEPEYFAFIQEDTRSYLPGFTRAAAAIADDLGTGGTCSEPRHEPVTLGATLGLIQCNVSQSPRNGAHIRVGIVDGGMDLGHPDFAKRSFVATSFVGTPVDDLLGHSTHIVGTACGPLTPTVLRPRYGIGSETSIFIAKVAGASTTTGVVLAGLNWAIANRCAVILTSLGSQTPVQAVYTAAGAAALSRGCLIVAPVGSGAMQTDAPANSPTIVAVTSLEPGLTPSPSSNFGKVDISAPGREVLSALPRPILHGVKSGTSMAAAHVAGCAALWAQTGPGVRGQALWKRLEASAIPLPASRSRIGSGLVQAP
jgi:subtilisin